MGYGCEYGAYLHWDLISRSNRLGCQYNSAPGTKSTSKVISTIAVMLDFYNHVISITMSSTPRRKMLSGLLTRLYGGPKQ